MKKIEILFALAATVFIMTACGQEETNGPIILENDPLATQSGTIVEAPIQNGLPTDVIVEDDTLPPEEGMVRSRLTNEWIYEDVANTRPIAVITPNESSAIPHYNLSNASIIYEANVEDRMTRMLVIYEDWKDLERIGNVRSLRSYYAYWAFEWDAFLVHFGVPFFINDLLAESTTQNIDGSVGSDDTAFFRTADRSSPHNAYVSGEGILDVINKKGYSLEYRGLTEGSHYNFATKAEPNTLEQYSTDARSATYIDMSGCYPLTRCYFEYNEEDGLYYRSQHLSGGSDGPHIDGATGEQLKFKNILVQNTHHEELGEGYLTFQCHDNTRDGWFFTNGKGIHVTWEKNSDYGATRYYDDYGTEITLNTGKTMVCIVEDGDTFTFH